MCYLVGPPADPEGQKKIGISKFIATAGSKDFACEHCGCATVLGPKLQAKREECKREGKEHKVLCMLCYVLFYHKAKNKIDKAPPVHVDDNTPRDHVIEYDIGKVPDDVVKSIRRATFHELAMRPEKPEEELLAALPRGGKQGVESCTTLTPLFDQVVAQLDPEALSNWFYGFLTNFSAYMVAKIDFDPAISILKAVCSYAELAKEFKEGDPKNAPDGSGSGPAPAQEKDDAAGK